MWNKKQVVRYGGSYGLDGLKLRVLLIIDTDDKKSDFLPSIISKPLYAS